ncbi:MAG: hypothetical protein FIA97_14155, partial [Methylococcaceae bacterium]|nr:hypothetical protein [Methylococcaceae bacterium]
TALQLQGHSGHVAECGVCHTADAFAKLEDLDEGRIPSDPKANVLGGPHNMHPVNDPNWWKSAPTDTGNRDGTTSGGWHNDVAKQPGRSGEDQCAACHGNDHKGTRLSKAAADRTFDFSDQPDAAALKAAGVKLKVFVKAGTPIGCNTCHSVAMSCQDWPTSDCGKPSDRTTGSLNQPPRFDSKPPATTTIGSSYRYQAKATDPDGDPVSYRISPAAEGLAIDPKSGMVTTPAIDPAHSANLINTYEPPFRFEFTVIAEDGKGGFATPPIPVAASCPGQLLWDQTAGHCQSLTFTSYPEINGLVAGETFSYQPATQRSPGTPAPAFSVTGAPPGLKVDALSGKVTWVAAADSSSHYQEFVLHAKAGPNVETQQTISLTVCLAPEYWNANYGSCYTPVHISSYSAIGGLNQGKTYSYQASAIHRDGKPVTWSLTGAPATMVLDPATGLINWNTAPGDAGDHSFTLTAKDAAGNQDTQDISLSVCGPPLHWDGSQCSGPIIFLSSPEVAGLDEGIAFSYQAVAAHHDHQPVHYSLKDAPAGMTISAASGLLQWDQTVEGDYTFAVVATDDKGNRQEQAIGLQVCGLPTRWDGNGCHGPVRITSSQPVYGLDAGQTFTYPVTAEHRDGKTLSFDLVNPPVGATVNPDSGQVQWVTTAESTDGSFAVRASDGDGNEDRQNISVTVCHAPRHWNAEQFSCL